MDERKPRTLDKLQMVDDLLVACYDRMMAGTASLEEIKNACNLSGKIMSSVALRIVGATAMNKGVVGKDLFELKVNRPHRLEIAGKDQGTKKDPL